MRSKFRTGNFSEGMKELQGLIMSITMTVRQQVQQAVIVRNQFQQQGDLDKLGSSFK